MHLNRHFALAPIFLFLFICKTASVSAQSIEGALFDSSLNKALDKASVVLIGANDSTLLHYTRSGSSGSFRLNDIDTGNFLLLISYPGYADYVDQIHIDSIRSIQLGTILMIRKEMMLKNVVVVGKRKAIVIKGDTVEFAADSFINKEGAMVEDLLKRLPGITVDKNGQVTAFGKTVEKVLVDGDEFFGDDPTMVTKNLKAQSVDKVQVYDQKSEQAQQTGIDDGQVLKTINIQLKEEAKKGYFGKVAIGGGNSDKQKIYESQAMINFFRKKRKVSAFGIMDNYNYGGLSWSDERKYAGKSYENYEGGSYSNNDWNDDMDISNKGFPLNRSLGFHFSDQLSEGKHKITVNYRLTDMFVEYQEDNFSKYIFTDSSYYESMSIQHKSKQTRNNFSMKYVLKIDSLTSITFKTGGNLSDKSSNKLIFSRSIANLRDTINDSRRITDRDGIDQSFYFNVAYSKRFKLKGRSIYITANQSSGRRNGSGLLDSKNNYYQSVNNPFQSIDQNKINLSNSNSLALELVYTEPLGKKMWYAEVHYSSTYSSNANSLLSYNLPALSIDSIYSNATEYNIYIQKVSAYIKADKKKFYLRLGSSYNYTLLNQTNKFNATTVKYPFANLFPELILTWKITKQKDLEFRFNGRTSQPTLSQIQPLRDNSDPLNIVVGNPNLKQEFTQNYSLKYNFYKVLGGANLWSGLDYSRVTNDIIYTTSINEQGIRSGYYTNINGNYYLSAYAYYGKSLKKIYSRASYNARLNYNHSNNYINSRANLNTTYSISNSFSFSFDKEHWPEVSLDYSPSYNYAVSSINPGVVTQYWQSQYEVYFDWPVTKRFSVATDVTISSRQKLDLSDKNNNFTIWNASVNYKFLKEKNAVLKFKVSDILNQRIGFERYANMAVVNETYYTLIARYWMFSFVWNFTDKKDIKKEEEDD